MITLGRTQPKKAIRIARGLREYARLLACAGIAVNFYIPRALAERLPLPKVCGGTACTGVGGPAQWVTQGSASLSQTATAMDVHQQTENVVLNWQQFNIGEGNSVTFHQPDAQSVAVNRVWDPSGDPSEIRGRLNSNGQVYLINRNGIIFGEKARVDVNTLIASAVDISDKVLTGGLLAGNTDTPASPAFADAAPGDVKVEQGAQIRVAKLGKAMLFGQTVENNGVITAPDGQIIVAAGNKIYLQASQDPNLRGLWVEVDGDAAAKVVNGESGVLEAARGNVTVNGVDVMQQGRVTATTALNANGSIYLRAGVTANEQKPGGRLEFGAHSITEVSAEADDGRTTADKAALLDRANGRLTSPSIVDAAADEVILRDGGIVRAPAGKVTLTAAQDLAVVDPTPKQNPKTLDQDQGSAYHIDPAGRVRQSRVDVQGGARIDVAGLHGAVAMERNQLEVFLTQNELNDFPAQRDGVLYRQTVYLDARKGTTVADVSDYLDHQPWSMSDVAARGGDVVVQSAYAANIEKDATIDVSGGSVHYNEGYIRSSKLVADGKIYDIATADPNRHYDGVLGGYTHHINRWGVTETRGGALPAAPEFQPGYTEGRDAGSVQVVGPAPILNGTLIGHATAGDQQRNGGDLPQGGDLIIGQEPKAGSQRLAPSVALVTAAAPQGAAGALNVPVDALVENGFSRFHIRSDAAISVGDGVRVDAGPGGQIVLNGQQVDVQGGLRAAGGQITLTTAYDDARAATGAARPITLGEHAVLDVSGIWINDNPLLAQPNIPPPLTIDGGRVVVASADELNLAQGARVTADGGAWAQANGQVRNGNGGDIELRGQTFHISGGPDGGDGGLGVQAQAYALGRGGRLTVEANNILIDHSAPSAPPGTTPPPLWLAPEFFQRGGFRQYNVIANRDRVEVGADTDIELRAVNLAFRDAKFMQQATGAAMSALTTQTVLTDDQRAAVDLNLSMNANDAASATADQGVFIDTGARIATETGGKITLTSQGRIAVDGTLVAPGGVIDAKTQEWKSQVGNPPNFDATRTLWIGDHASLSVAGAFKPGVVADGHIAGEVWDGGTLTLQADRAMLVVAEGAELDVSGARHTVDIADGHGGWQRRDIASAGGRLTLRADEGMFVDGNLHGAAGDDTATGGSLKIVGNVANSSFNGSIGVTQIQVSATGGTSAVAGRRAGDEIPDAWHGQAYVSAQQIAEGGFDDVSLTAPALSIDAGTTLVAPRCLLLDAPVVVAQGSGVVEVQAAYVRIGGTGGDADALASTARASGGEAQLNIAASRHLDLIGYTTLQGIDRVTLHSDGDLRVLGAPTDRQTAMQRGQVAAAGDIDIVARQLYPATQTDFTFTTVGDVSIAGIGTDPAPVLSAGGALHIQGEHITQAGIVKAPLGTLDLNAATQLTLADGSVTSVSAQGQFIPYGTTVNGGSWTANGVDVTTPPEKHVRLQGPAVSVTPGAKIDVSGGGDVYATELLPATAHPSDALANPNRYVIVPGYQGEVAPFDPTIGDGGLALGARMHLSGVAGLPEGDYVLLPARYATLPGAWVIEQVPGFRDIAATQPARLTDGTPVAAGYSVSSATASRNARTDGYALRQGEWKADRDGVPVFTFLQSHVAQRSGDDYFIAHTADGDAQPRLARDAGGLAISAGERLDLKGELIARADADGRGAAVDIAADRVVIVDDANVEAGVGVVALAAQDLNRLGAESLLIGGTRRTVSDGIALDVRAQSVSIAEGVQIRGPEILLAAQDSVTVGQHARVAASGQLAHGDAVITVDGDGALLRVASTPMAAIRRRYTDESTAGRRGTLRIEQNASLDAGLSLILDAAHTIDMHGKFAIAEGGGLNIGTTHINLGDAPAEADGMVLDPTLLQSLDVAHLALTSRRGIDIYGPVTLQAHELTLDTPALTGHGLGADQRATVAADRLVLTNHNTTAAATLEAGGGTLALHADTVELRAVKSPDPHQPVSTLAVGGFDRVEVGGAATQDIAITGAGALNVVIGADTVLRTARVTGGAGVDFRMTAQDGTGAYRNLDIQRSEATTPVDDGALAAHLAFTGKRVDVAAPIVAHAGGVSLQAKGGAADDAVQLHGGGAIDVSGTVRDFAGQGVATDGGKVSLSSAQGDVSVDAGATIVLRGGQRDALAGNAGELDVQAAHGRWVTGGDIQAQAATGVVGAQGGKVSIDQRTLIDADTLHDWMNASGFTAQQHLRVREGDVTLGAIDVNATDYRLTTDQGSIDTQANYHASGVHAGRVELWAGKDLRVHGNSAFDAHATGIDARGGQVVLAAGGADKTGILDIGVGATDNVVIDVSGQGARADSGRVLMRAPRRGADDVSIDHAHANITGAGEAVIEAVEVRDLPVVNGQSVINTATRNGINTANQMYMTAVQARAVALKQQLTLLSARDGLSNANTAFHFRPGVELRGAGSIVLNPAWDLSSWRYGGEPGVLTLRAQQDVIITGNLSDGFAGAQATSPVSTSGDAWSYRIAAGADMTSGMPLTTEGTAAGDVKLGPSAIVRSGNGDIDIAAARDIVFGNEASAVYTAGVATATRATTRIKTAAYLDGGGDVTLTAGRDIARDPQSLVNQTAANQLINEWLHHAGGTVNIKLPVAPASWWINTQYFQQNVGTLGGGDVTLRAGQDVVDVSAVAATSRQENGTLTGGGDVAVSAGRDIHGGVYFVARGEGLLHAGGELTTATRGTTDYLPVLALIDGQWRVVTDRGVALATVFNPTVAPVSVNQQTGAGYTEVAAKALIYAPAYFSYASGSAVGLMALSGDVALSQLRPGGQTALFDVPPGTPSNKVDSGQLYIYPATLRAIALQGSVTWDHSLALMPSPTGTLDMLAQRDVVAVGPDAANLRLTLSDFDPHALPSVDQPQLPIGAGNAVFAFSGEFANPQSHSPMPLHTSDAQPVHIVAHDGDIAGGQYFLAKYTIVDAGRDVRDVTIAAQNIEPDDITRVSAGRDIAFPAHGNGKGDLIQNTGGILVLGPGELQLRAGRDIDLGNSTGIVSSGNLYNPALAGRGADVLLIAGVPVGTSSAGAMAGGKVLDAWAIAQAATYQAGSPELRTLTQAWRVMRQDQTLTEDEARQELLRDPAAHWRDLLFVTLRLAAESKDYSAADAALKTLFPGNQYNGNLSLYYSQIRTLQGGNIDVFVPGGMINAGLSVNTAGAPSDPSKLGIVAQDTGRVFAYTQGDFLVNQSRVFTLRGGDLLLWSRAGNIDAGRGAKSTQASPRPTSYQDSAGNTHINLPPAAQGSGIQVQVTQEGDHAGNATLVAPMGEINAGDAGIKSAGGVLISAPRVAGADNIVAAGGVAGIPSVDSGALSLNMSGMSGVGAGTSQAAEQALTQSNKAGEPGKTPMTDDALSFLNVEVLSFGEM